MASEKVMEALKEALQNEEKTAAIYREAAQKTSNPVVKKTMEFLTKWEEDHAEKIKQMHAHLMGEMEVIDVKTMCAEDPVCVVGEFFGKNKAEFDEKLAGDPEDLKVYETGMDIEKTGHDFYMKAASEADEGEAKQLFEFLAKEETIHFDFLQDQHSYLSDPTSWHLDEERWTLEG